MRLRRILVLFVVVFSAGCARAPFTKKLIAENGLKPDDLKDLQFYASTPIVLSREVASLDSSTIAGHELRTVRGKVIETIVIKR